MRTTITLEPDAEQLIRQLMAEQSMTFKAAINEAIRRGVRQPKPFNTTTFGMGQPAVSLDKSLQLSAELEDEELLRKMQAGK